MIGRRTKRTSRGARSSSRTPLAELLPVDPKEAALILGGFAGTMLLEAAVLRGGPKRTFGDLDHATREELSNPSLPPDPLVPVGYESRDTKASLAMLLGNQIANGVTFGITHSIDRWLYRRRVANLGERRGGFAMAMIAWDFLYYWDHRWMHEVRLLWANHVSHHNSERYNLSTALRQPWSGILTNWVFWPMPLLGFRPSMVARAGLYNLLYQYWIHTEVIDRMPKAFEAVMNTPSHHRAHHGANPQYLDTNYAGILIVWDRLFGSFEPEVRRVKYGLTKNIDSFNPFVIAYHEFAAIVRDVRQADRLGDKLRHIVGRPGWTPEPDAVTVAA